VESIAKCIDRQFNREIVSFARLMCLFVAILFFLISTLFIVRIVRSGRVMTIPPPLITPITFFCLIGAVAMAVLAMDSRRLADADAAVDQLEAGQEEELLEFVRSRSLLHLALKRRHVRRGRLSDYLSFLVLLLPEERPRDEVLDRWNNFDVLKEVSEASRDCERLAPLHLSSFVAGLAMLGFSQGIAMSAERRLGLNLAAQFGLQLALFLIFAYTFFGYLNARRKPGLDRFKRIVGELSDEQLEDLKFDPHLTRAVQLEVRRRKREA